MPHDRDGRLLKEGDKVLVPAIVRTVSPGEDYCNVTVENLPKPPEGQVTFCVTLNSKQVVKEGNVDHDSPAPGDAGDVTHSG